MNFRQNFSVFIIDARVAPAWRGCSGHLTVALDICVSDGAGEGWRAGLGGGAAPAAPLCDVYTGCTGHTGLVSAHITPPGDRSSGAREQRAPAAGSSLADSECLWRRHPEPGDQLSLPALWPLGAGVCYELTSAEPEH